MHRLTAEFLGTFFLCLVSLHGDPLAVCLGLAALIWTLGSVSGAYFNPAISLSQRLRGAISTSWALAYAGVHLLAGAAAALVGALLSGYDAERLTAEPVCITDDWLASLTSECLGTLLVALVILGVANARRNAGNSFGALAIGGAVLAAGAVFGDHSAFLNPAVTWSAALHHLFSAVRAEDGVGRALTAEVLHFGAFAPWAACLVAAQLAGAALANGCFWLTHLEDRRT